MITRIRNVHIYTEEHRFHHGNILLNDERILCMENNEESLSVDVTLEGENAYAIPGLIDMHLHGYVGADFCDGTTESLEKIAEYELSAGITCFAPATMALPVRELHTILQTASAYQKSAGTAAMNSMSSKKRAELVGIHMEAPFISREKCGAQDPSHILPFRMDLALEFLEQSDGLVKVLGIAPEVNPDYPSFIPEMKKHVNVALSHTNATYQTALSAIDAGANHVVHLYNGMSAFSHREPGVVGAVYDRKHVTAELICDGVHLHPAVVRSAFSMLGEERIILISDSMRGTGMPDGTYLLGGLEVKKTGRRAQLVNGGGMAGSVSNLMDCITTAVKEMGIPFESVVRCATENPAKCLDIWDDYGSITPGKYADIVLLNPDLSIKRVIKKGQW